MPLNIDPLQGVKRRVLRSSLVLEGNIPQVVGIAPDGRVVLDRDGQVPLQMINTAISEATGLPAPDERSINPGGSFNEVNIEVEVNPG